ncbi:unnamed protein product, partial [Allacma fusca]
WQKYQLIHETPQAGWFRRVPFSESEEDLSLFTSLILNHPYSQVGGLHRDVTFCSLGLICGQFPKLCRKQ